MSVQSWEVLRQKTRTCVRVVLGKNTDLNTRGLLN